jgi:hypothetical protein
MFSNEKTLIILAKQLFVRQSSSSFHLRRLIYNRNDFYHLLKDKAG